MCVCGVCESVCVCVCVCVVKVGSVVTDVLWRVEVEAKCCQVTGEGQER